MEMTAATVRALKRPCDVRVFTDSEYLLSGMTNSWSAGRRMGGDQLREMV
jgi:ribonuclease HI